MADQELREYRQNVVEWVRAFPSNVPRYIHERFPIIRWLPKYSRSWAMKDIVAGITVGLIVVPQGMSYAKVAGLPVQHGLYSAYIGAIFYCFMGTSKDLTIGPTAVISLITGELVAQLAGRYSPAQVAGISCLAVGALTMVLGALQLGIILDFFPSTVLIGYTTGAAATIVISQIPKWIGVSGVNTREPPYLVLINTVKALPTLSWLDLAFGLFSMLGLVGIGYVVDRWGKGRFSIQLIKISRFFIVTVLATAFSFLVNINAPYDLEGNIIPRISILKTVPSGLPTSQAPKLDGSILVEIAPKLIAIALATILEHIAIGKAFARKNRYQIDSNQELLTLGLANVTASFFGAYTVTGSFSRSAVKFQCGVKTPLAGLVTGALVLLALQMLTPLFYYIPDAALSAVIMVAVSSLVSFPDVFMEFFDVNLWDFVSSQVALWVTLFVSVEVGIAAGVGFSLVVLLFRVARPQIHLLQPLRTRPDVFVTSTYSTSKIMDTVNLPPGVLVFRMEEGATFPNMETFKTWAQDQVYKHTRFGGLTKTAHDRLWSDDLEIHIRRLRAQNQHSSLVSLEDKDLSYLRAVILDCSAMNNIDSTGLQGLRDLHENLKDYAGARDDPEVFFELHFVAVQDNVLPILERSGLTTPSPVPGSTRLRKVQVLSRDFRSVSALDSVVHLTIRDAINAVLRHAEVWKRALNEDTILEIADMGGSGSFISDSDSDEDSLHKQPSTHELQYI
ncbi:sulfate transporter family-domain-containing protein [Gamsiella multidivaricata]|uniref:sulfate transporter family-domain-containing protein n=1 Tax=Gamsiella multidivaricata TaxID=101098 RepID=UPI00222019E9|nr:sulfate transporter family-domain-containing protein [Gamsiella multidivaricata]KAI7830178.1 sulfate transporter family-domain-containing protein [Gamsiella multidivaricata]